MEEKKAFDKEKYRSGEVGVFCDRCGTEIDFRQRIESRVIARQPEGYDVAEEYFTCHNCGRHYTILIVDHEMRFLIQQRQQIAKQIRLHKQIRSREKTFLRLKQKDEALKRKQEERMEILKERYKAEIEGGQ